MLYVQRTDDSYHHYDYEDFYGSGYDDYEEGSGGII